MSLSMRTVLTLVVITMPVCIVGQTYAVSLADLVNNGGSITSGDVTFSNFTGTFGPTSTSAIPPAGCCHFATTSDINFQPTIAAGFTISGIELSGGWSRANTLVTPNLLFYELILGYDVTVHSSQSERLMGAGLSDIQGVNVVGVFLNSGSESVRTFFPDPTQVSTGPRGISGSFFHIDEKVDILPLGACSIGPPSPVSLGVCSLQTGATITNSFSAVSAIPEPSTVLLLITGFSVIAFTRYKVEPAIEFEDV